MGAKIDRRGEPPEADLSRLVAVAELAALAETGVEVEVSVLLCDDAAIAELNQRYLGHDGPTDVLSFPQHELAPGQAALSDGDLLGDVAISVETAARQAAEFADWSLDDELALLVVHGLLHLCGWDDLDEAARGAMQRREDELLALAGIGRPPRDE